jgi:mannose-6-phosphate isomerase-like protein (cupin superfamily)
MTTAEKFTDEELGKLEPSVLDDIQRERQWYHGRALLEIQRRRGQKRRHLSAEEAGLGQGDLKNRNIISPELGFDIYNLHIFTGGVAPRTEQVRNHVHGDTVKHYLSGKGYEVVGDQRIEVKAGDFVHIPANVWSGGSQNPHDEPLRFLAWQQFPGVFSQIPTPFIDQNGPPDAAAVSDLSDDDLARLDPRELYQVYLKSEMEYGQVQVEVQRRRSQKRLYISAEEAPIRDWQPGGPRKMIIAPEYGFDIYTFHLFVSVMPPHKEEGSGHFHGDAVKWYLTGSGYEEIEGSGKVPWKPGDFIHIPGFLWHRTVNTSDEIGRFVALQQYPGTFRQTPNPWQWNKRM